MNPWRVIGYVCALFLALWIAVLMCNAAHSATFPTKYDVTIKKASERWMPGVPWKLLKAQLYQESKLDPTAHSPVGAEGIAQFMPATWAEVSRTLGYRGVGRSMADPAIEAAAYYMSRMKALYPTVAELEKHRMGAASYNAGGGNILKARRLCGGTDEWEVVAKCLPKVTGRHSTETITYVERIWRWWEMMEIG